MKFSDLIPNTRLLTHPWEVFKSRDGKPFAQSVARNLGHMLHGEGMANYVDQHFLGDAPKGTLGPVQGMAATVQPTATLTPLPQTTPNTNTIRKGQPGFVELLNSLAKAQQGGM
jgi:hypothetical protein